MMLLAGVAELVDALDLGSSDESCGGSSPSARTKRPQRLSKTNFRRTCFPKGNFPEGLVRRTTGAGLKSRAEQIDNDPALQPDQAWEED
jgi:hypothetical protein